MVEGKSIHCVDERDMRNSVTIECQRVCVSSIKRMGSVSSES